MELSAQSNWYDQSAGPPGGDNPPNTPRDAVPAAGAEAAAPVWADPEIPQPPASTDASPAEVIDAAPAAPTDSQTRLAKDPRYRTAMLKIQHGAWPEAANLLAALRTDYPDVAILEPLHNEAQLRAHLVVTWEDKVRGRRMTVKQQRLLRRALPFMAVLLLFAASLGFYQILIAPSRHVIAMESANQSKVEEAQGLFQNGQYQEALAVYEEVLGRDPANQGALTGKADTEKMLALAAEYDMAMELAELGNVDRAIAFFTSIQERAPAFRDVRVQIEKLQEQVKARELFEAAEAAYQDQRWLEAVDLYAQSATLAGADKAPIIEQYLQAAYLPAAMAILSQRPTEQYGPKEAEDLLRQALNREPMAQTELDLLEAYFQGEAARKADALDDAANYWRSIYDVRPTYLGGLLAEELYRVYVEMGSRAETSRDTNYAASLYQLAAGVQGVDTYEATTRLSAIAPTPTPEPSPTPEPVYYAAPAAPEEPPTPTPDPRVVYQGWIAFRTNRSGFDDVFIMRPDGTEQQPAPDSLRAGFEELNRQQTFTADGTRELFVGVPEGRTDANLYMRVVEASGAMHDEMQTDFTGDEFEPAWSPAGDRMAYVSNHTGNDEIWVMVGPGDHRQLTFNEWEWDKHPTWSPDGIEIAFYSNRTGQRQIWVMNGEGAGQRNVSLNGYEDWDPVWIK